MRGCEDEGVELKSSAHFDAVTDSVAGYHQDFVQLFQK